jgi:hypothetical protein
MAKISGLIAIIAVAMLGVTACAELFGDNPVVRGKPQAADNAPFDTPATFDIRLSSLAPGADFGFIVHTQFTNGQRELYSADNTLPAGMTFNGFDRFGAGAMIGAYGFDFTGSTAIDRYLPIYAIDANNAYVDSNLNGSYQSPFEPLIVHSGGNGAAHRVRVTAPFGGDGDQTITTARFNSNVTFGLRTGLFTHDTVAGTQNVGMTFTSIDPDTDDANDNMGAAPIEIVGNFNPVTQPDTLAASVLPGTRSVLFDTPATFFATIANAATTEATNCSVVLATPLPADFTYQTTNPSTNQPTGSANTPGNIAGSAFQTYVLSLTAKPEFFNGTQRPFPDQDVEFLFDCDNTPPASVFVGINTLGFSASTTPVPDIITNAATAQNNGIFTLDAASGAGAFAIAGVNIGAQDTITVAPRATFSSSLALNICDTTGQAGGACINPPSSDVVVAFETDSARTLSIFGSSTEAIALSPAGRRVMIDFTDSNGKVRGSTSVAVQFSPN